MFASLAPVPAVRSEEIFDLAAERGRDAQGLDDGRPLPPSDDATHCLRTAAELAG
jgi:hypothetical protein